MAKTAFVNLRIYNLAEKPGDLAWHVATKWDYLAKDTLGKQFVNSADSVGANIAEGAGRGTPADNKRFVKIARGSLYEVKHWPRRAYKRNLLNPNEIDKFQEILEELTPKLSAYINSIGKKSK